MARLAQEEVDDLARKYINLRNRAEKTGEQSDHLRFKSFQNICIQKFKYLVVYRTIKYKKFSNHQDLEQDGFEAMINAFRTFDPDKGSFSWWADKYIKTKVSRTANAHSTIKFPMKAAKEVKPYKISTMPVQIEPGPSPLDEAERLETAENIGNAIEKLPQKHRQVVSMKYGFNGIRERPVGVILEDLSISRQQYSRILSEAEDQIKKHLLRIE